VHQPGRLVNGLVRGPASHSSLGPAEAPVSFKRRLGVRDVVSRRLRARLDTRHPWLGEEIRDHVIKIEDSAREPEDNALHQEWELVP
jgi:hypothetical protein